jgi:hypothetical protein
MVFLTGIPVISDSRISLVRPSAMYDEKCWWQEGASLWNSTKNTEGFSLDPDAILFDIAQWGQIFVLDIVVRFWKKCDPKFSALKAECTSSQPHLSKAFSSLGLG